VLAVVQHQQQPLVAHERGQPFRRRRPRAAARLLAQPQHGDHRLRQQPGVAQPGQLDQPHAVRPAVPELAGQLDRQAGLAGTARPGDRHQPVLLDQLADLAQLDVAADEAGQPLRQVLRRRRHRGGVQRRVLGEDPAVQVLQLR
jgi:hypothetical protein